MPRYEVEIPVTSTRSVEVEADSEEEAIRIAARYEEHGKHGDPEFAMVFDWGLFDSEMSGDPRVTGEVEDE